MESFIPIRNHLPFINLSLALFIIMINYKNNTPFLSPTMNKTTLSPILISSAILMISLLITGCAGEDVEKSCSDGIKNQDETDVDCGGSCDPCTDGKACETDDDCVNKCSSNNKCYTPTKTSSTTPTPTRRTEQKEAELTEEIITKIENKLEPNLMNAFAISEGFRTMEAGDSYTFGFGLINVHTKPFYFKINVEFEEAVDKSSNKLEGIDPEYVNDWLDQRQFVSEIAPSEQKMWPLNLKVGDEVADGTPTKPGTYTYYVRVYYGDDASLVESIKDQYVSKKTLTIRVT